MPGPAGRAACQVPPQTSSGALQSEVLRKAEAFGTIKTVALVSQMERSSPVLFLPGCF